MTEIRATLVMRTALISLHDLEAIVGMPPSRGHSRGDVRFGGRQKRFQTPLTHTTWILTSTEAGTASLTSHIQALVDALPPHRVQNLRPNLPSDLRVEIDIALFYEGQAGYLDIEPQVLQVINSYGATLLFTAYYCEDEEQKLNAEAASADS